MRPYIIALASALLLAAIVTIVSLRLWPGNALALLLVSSVALFVNGLFNARFAKPAGGSKRSRSRGRNANRNQRRSTNSGPRSKNSAEDSGNKATKGGSANKSGSGRDAGRDGRNKNNNAGSPAPQTPAPARPAAAPLEAGREAGTVKWFNRSKGFGFIVRDSGEEIFVHQRSIRVGDNSRRPSLRDGESVTFTVAEHEKGLQAEDVVADARA